MTIIESTNVITELVYFLRNSDILTITERGVATETDTGTFASDSTHLIDEPNIKNIRSITVGTLQEYHNTGDNSFTSIEGNNWRAQKFTVGTVGTDQNFTITSLKLKMFRTGSPGTMTFSIKAVDGSGIPTGSDLSVGTTDGDTLTISSTGEFREITMSSFELQASTKYAIVMRAPDGNGSDFVNMRLESTGTYSGGNIRISGNGGLTWPAQSNADHMFEVWGYASELSFGTDYTYDIQFDDSGTIKTKITFTSAQTGSFIITFDKGTDKIYPDYPRDSLNLSSYPRIAVDIISETSTPQGFGNQKIAVLTEFLITTSTYAATTNKVRSMSDSIKTAIMNNQNGFFFFKITLPQDASRIQIANTTKNEIFQQTRQFISITNLERPD